MTLDSCARDDVTALLAESDAAFVAGDADAWADCFADYFLRDDGAGWRIRLLMNSHSQPMEPIE